MADASDGWDLRPIVDISSADTREARRAIPIAGEVDATVAHYVPFFLSPHATLWQSIRSNSRNVRLSRDILKADAADFVILVTTVKTITDSGTPFVVADGDAAHTATRFGTTIPDAEAALRRLRADQESEAPRILQAEFLVRKSLPFENVTLVGVAHDKARAAVRDILDAADFAPKVAVYPPWFAAEEG